MNEFYEKALSLYNSGHLDEAKKNCDRGLELDSNNVNILYLLATISARVGSLRECIELLDKVINIKPNFLEAYYNRGVAFHELKKFNLAIDSFEKVINTNPNYAWAHYKKANSLQSLNKLEESIIAYEKAISLKPNLAEAHYNMALSLHNIRRLDDAISSYNNAINIKPNFAQAYYNKGQSLSQIGMHKESIISFENAILFKPDYALAYCGLGDAFEKLGDLENASQSYKKALEIEPKSEIVFGSYFHIQMLLCNWVDFTKNLAFLMSEIISKRRIVSPLFVIISLIDDPNIHLIAAKLYSKHKYPKNNILGDIPKKTCEKKIRIAYFSGDFHEHPVSYLTAELFELHDRTKFEVIAFSFFKKKHKSPMRERLIKAFDIFVDVHNKSDKEIASLSRDYNIDIAIDLTGETANGRHKTFSYRAAPIQINYIGYLGTTGSNYFDYIIADKIIIPDKLKQNYTEKIVTLPSYQVNQRNAPIVKKRFSRSDHGLPENQFVYCCFNSNYKILPSIFDSWMKILAAVKNSILFLHSNIQQVEINLRNEARARNIDCRRIVFGKRLCREDYLSRFLNCDLFLDTLPYNAGATASDALWSGLPILTIQGNSFAGRQASSLLNAISLPELITYSHKEYEEKAIDLATNPKKLQEIKAKLENNKFTSKLFDTSHFTKNIELAYIKMHERYQNNLSPIDIDIK